MAKTSCLGKSMRYKMIFTPLPPKKSSSQQFVVWVLSEPELIHWYLIGLGKRFMWEKLSHLLNRYGLNPQHPAEESFTALNMSTMLHEPPTSGFHYLVLCFVVFLGSSCTVLGFVGGKSQPDTMFSRMWFGNHCPMPGFLLNVARRLRVMLPQKVISLATVLHLYKRKV